ncbi:histidine phosphatase family protein [Nocardia farcinica]|nr:histidine phosphatase family protein [Nocardia farcinica]MBF6310711.1 histidine phosphatase family protein [Nocardia farcinica]MBF6405469.1 histidine phosphatase family protein [Nocardia farcinica]
MSNVDGVVAGSRTCLGLTDRGHSQAVAVADYLAAECHRFGTIVVYSTAVRRAVQTAEPIAAKLGVPFRPEFPYHEHGDAEGQRRAEITADPTPTGSAARLPTCSRSRLMAGGSPTSRPRTRHAGDTAPRCNRHTRLPSTDNPRCSSTLPTDSTKFSPTRAPKSITPQSSNGSTAQDEKPSAVAMGTDQA